MAKRQRLLDKSFYDEDSDNSDDSSYSNSLKKTIIKRTKKDIEMQIKIEKEEQRLNSLANNNVSLKQKIIELNCDDKIKLKALNLLQTYENDSENGANFLSAINLICNINWSKYHDLNISNMITFLESAYEIMNKTIYGQKRAKMEILEYLIAPLKERTIGLVGPAGVGKTTLIKNALSKCLNNRPFYYISLGGLNDVNVLAGSAPVWKNSNAGRLIDALIDTKCMNPIIYFDEIDKIGPESNIHSYLIHLIDPVYNSQIYNNFLDITIDYSKVMFIFSYNNPALVNKILLDRIKQVEMNTYDKIDLNIIVEQYILPQIFTDMKISNKLFIFSKTIIDYINNYVKNTEGSIRPLIRLYQDIIAKLYMNYILLNNNSVLKELYNIKYVNKVDKKTIDSILEQL
jgi:ATP-dependent Lon protease